MKLFTCLVLTLLMAAAVSSNSGYAYGYKYSNNPYSGECRLQLNLPGYGENLPPRRYGTPYYSKHPTIGHPSPPTYNGQSSALAPRRPSPPRPVSRPPAPPANRFPPAANPSYTPEIRRPPSPPAGRFPPPAAVNPNYAPEIRRPQRPPPSRDYDRDAPPQTNYRRPSPPRRPAPVPPSTNYRRPSAPRAPAVTPYNRPSPSIPREPDFASAPEDYEGPQEPFVGRPDLSSETLSGGGNNYDSPVVSREVDRGFDQPTQYGGSSEFDEPEETYVDNEVGYDPDGDVYGGGNSGGRGTGENYSGRGTEGNYGGRGSGSGGRGGGGGSRGGGGGGGAGNYGGGAGNYGNGASNYGGGNGGRYGNEYKKKKK